MTLPAPRLDTRTFEDLVREARARIPRYTPEWTDLNDSDPGMALVQLHAWLVETVLFELNRVPELNHVKFLDLLGIVPRPAAPARTELTVTLDRLDRPTDPLVVPVPSGTKVSVDDPDLPAEVVFETDRTLLALNAHIGVLLAHSDEPERGRALVTSYGDDGTVWLHSFTPLDPAMPPGAALYLGLVLRPGATTDLARFADDRLPAGPLDLYVDAVQVHDVGADGAVVAGPLAQHCPPPVGTGSVPAAAAAPRRLVWQLHTGDTVGHDHAASDTDDTGWTDLAVSTDETLGLSRSGHLVLELPPGGTALSPVRFAAEWWDAFGQPKPPQSKSELLAALGGVPDAPLTVAVDAASLVAGLQGRWGDMGVDDPDALALDACHESVEDTLEKLGELPAGVPDPSLLPHDAWAEVDPAFAVAMPMGEAVAPRTGSDLRPLHWLRARVVATPGPDEPRPAELRAVHLGTVPATQASSRLDDTLGRSTGRPAQTFALPRTPVLVDPVTGEPDLALHVGDDGAPWQRRPDFFRSGPGDPHYLLDPGTGVVAFGDGLRGAVPVAGQAVVARRWRTGGGAVGNVGPGTVSRMKGRVRGVKGITNLRAASGGADAEPLGEVLLRAPHDLRTRDRAVTAADFADLAQQTPGAALHKAYALARRAVAPDGTLVERDGAVTVVVLPTSSEPAPQPTEAQLRGVCRWLDPRRLVTTELHVRGPDYTTVRRLAARVTVADGHDLVTVAEALQTALVTLLHPVHGGADGTGWPFGDDLHHGDLYELMLAVPGVRRVTGLVVELDDPGAGSGEPGARGEDDPGAAGAHDVTVLQEGHMPLLARDAVDLVVRYG